jgi:quercetin dioxygenase-like cupin family protein
MFRSSIPAESAGAAAVDALIAIAASDSVASLGLYEMILGEGGCLAGHSRPKEDELFRVTAGRFAVGRGRERIILAPGDVMLLSHGIPRTIENAGHGEARAMVVVVGADAIGPALAARAASRRRAAEARIAA